MFNHYCQGKLVMLEFLFTLYKTVMHDKSRKLFTSSCGVIWPSGVWDAGWHGRVLAWSGCFACTHYIY